MSRVRGALNRVDRYGSFAELARHEREGRAWRVRLRPGASAFAILAPHGGRIERGTSWLADAIAGAEHTFYAFEGLRRRANHRLHVTSNRFDEPRALAAAARAHTVLTVHGAAGAEAAVYVGGRDEALRERLLAALAGAGFAAAPDPSPTRQGRGVTNICNRGRSGCGVQLELPVGMRRRLFEREAAGVWRPNAAAVRLVQTVRAVLEATL